MAESKLIVLCVLAFLIASALYVNFRGKVRQRLLRQVGTHNIVMYPYNILMYWFSAVPARPILNVQDFPALGALRAQWRTIRDEAAALLSRGQINTGTGHNDVGFNSFYKTGWKRFYLKWYDSPLPSAVESCPQTVALLQAIPTVRAAMFAVLPPGSKLNPHRDPYAGSLRYHLGLATPNHDDCRIHIDGEPYSWRDGQDIVFDETYVHWAANETQQTRIILFCDVERPLRTPLMRAINRFVGNTFVRAGGTQNVPTEKIGLLNRIYALTGKDGRFEHWKREHYPIYRVMKFTAIGGIAYLLFFVW